MKICIFLVTVLSIAYFASAQTDISCQKIEAGPSVAATSTHGAAGARVRINHVYDMQIAGYGEWTRNGGGTGVLFRYLFPLTSGTAAYPCIGAGYHIQYMDSVISGTQIIHTFGMLAFQAGVGIEKRFGMHAEHGLALECLYRHATAPYRYNTTVIIGENQQTHQTGTYRLNPISIGIGYTYWFGFGHAKKENPKPHPFIDTAKQPMPVLQTDTVVPVVAPPPPVLVQIPDTSLKADTASVQITSDTVQKVDTVAALPVDTAPKVIAQLPADTVITVSKITSAGIVLKGVTFATLKAEILAPSRPLLDAVVTSLKENIDVNIEVAGYSDNTGNEKRNRAISQKRAESVRQYFIDEGINPARITAKGYGQADPIADNNTPEGRTTNRRVEVHRTN